MSLIKNIDLKTINTRSKYISYIVAFLFSSIIYGQGATCAEADPFCAGGASLVFENTSDGSTAEVGPDYGCLGSEPNPAWYYLQISQDGNLDISISQNTMADGSGAGLDVDFICYGPFATNSNCGATNLTALNTVACSYSAAPVENFTIPNAMAGEVYILLITNFQGSAGFIQVEQTNSGGAGAGGTDCSIVNTADQYCDGEVVSLDATNGAATIYEWDRDGVPLAETGPILNGVVAPSAVYTVNKYSSPGVPIETEVFNIVFNAVPVANPVLDYILCDDTTADGMTVFDLTTKDIEVTGAQTGMTVTYHTDPMDATMDMNPLPTNYTNVNGNPELIYVRIENSNNEDCFATTSFNLQVDELPTAATAADMIVCDDVSNDGVEIFDLTSQQAVIAGAPLPANRTVSYHETQADANTGMNPIVTPGAFPNVGSPDPIFVRVENDLNPTCFATSTFDLIVNVLPIAATAPPMIVCDDASNDGIEVFDLTSQEAVIAGAPLPPNTMITYHETQADADNNVGAIATPTAFTNVGSPDPIFVRVENTLNPTCYTTSTFNLQVDVLPIVATAPPMIVCDDLSNDGVEIFDLTSQEATIAGAPLPPNTTVTYHETQADADNGVGAIVTPTTFSNVGSPDPIFVRLENDLNTNCYAVSTFDLIVNPVPMVVAPTPIRLCDDETADGFTMFDLTIRNAEITGGNANYTVEYYETLADALAGTGAIADPTMYTNTSVGGLPQTIYIRVTDTSTASNCFITNITLEIEVFENPTPESNITPYPLCDDNGGNDGMEIFDLTTKNPEIFNGQPYTATYHNSENDAENNLAPIATPTAYQNTTSPETIYVRVENADGCHDVVNFDLIVNPLPDVIGVPDLIGCELNTDGFFDFDLESKTDELLNGQSPAIFTVTYHETQLDADNNTAPLTSPYTNMVIDRQEIFVSITNTTTSCAISTISFFIEVRNQPTATQPANDFVICDYLGDNDGFGEFDLSTQDVEILNGQLPADYTVTYYDNQMDAMDGVNQLPNLYPNESNPQTIYARVENNLGFCYELTEVILRVELLPEINLEDNYILCLDASGAVIATADSPPVIDTGLSDADHDFEWSYEGTVLAGETMSTLTATQTGNYSVTATETVTGLGCMATATTVVSPSSPPAVVAEVISDAFSDNHMIEVTATGTGVYEFSLDGGPWVLGTDNGDGTYTYVFNNVNPPGEHTVTARDVNSCGEDSDTVIIMDYPLFLTPNGDGFNDTWNIVNIQTQPNAKIYIYDRYGKLLKQLNPTGTGWDGTFNGEALPSSDYWFTVNYTEPRDGAQKLFKSHFTLKR